MSTRRMFPVACAFAACAIGLPPAFAGPEVMFDFNHSSLSDTGSGLNVDNSAAVKAYMNLVLAGSGISVTAVTGAKVERDYDGDDHVVGPALNGGRRSLTLGNNDGKTFADSVTSLGADNFLVNHSGTDRITITFDRPIHSVSFDYEIFPNSQCTNPPGSCSLWPDFIFKAGGVEIFREYGLDPESAKTMGGVPVTMAYRQSPFSSSGWEKAPQRLDVSGERYVGGAKKLEFIDWPSTIGIDRLRVTFVAEPGSLALIGAAVASLWLLRRRTQRASR